MAAANRPPCQACGRRVVARRRCYADGQVRYYCVPCNDQVASIERTWRREVACFHAETPISDRLARRIDAATRALEAEPDEDEVIAWLRGAHVAFSKPPR
jgi:hypothetical protein